MIDGFIKDFIDSESFQNMRYVTRYKDILHMHIMDYYDEIEQTALSCCAAGVPVDRMFVSEPFIKFDENSLGYNLVGHGLQFK